MKKYRAQVVMSFWQTVEVEAENERDAEIKAYKAFDVNHPDLPTQYGEGQVMELEEITTETGESK